ncbi:DUF4189 domain-containing protein [Xanthomonas sp. MUS 060]|uniref:DUF4189 domain-containing protein n=1 Tax=Xanthomonas sp. MUS 060 TaxID=1588031 RepID=UPI0009E39868|nr:DUF4189 domain-containing protein [Xanthomonas sp. MUS 060]
MKYLTCMAFFMLIFSIDANAEGNCPPGQYPIGGQGAVGCAPIPQDIPETQKARPAGKWLKTWGAVADDGADDVGVSSDKISKNEAENEAVEKCQGASKHKCHVIHTYENQCVAVAEPAQKKGDFIRNVASGPSVNEISSRATYNCEKDNATTRCNIIYTNCTKQIFQRF